MKTRLEEIEELLSEQYKLIGVQLDTTGYRHLISEIVKLEVEKNEILKNTP